jgi:hypothetical protein
VRFSLSSKTVFLNPWSRTRRQYPQRDGVSTLIDVNQSINLRLLFC